MNPAVAPSPRRRTLHLLVALAAGILVLAGCSGGDDDTAEGETVLSSEPQVVDADDPAVADESSTTTAPTTTEPAPPAGRPTPLESAQTLYDAWFADDRVTAATVAEPDAVEAMWLTARGDYAVYNQCDSGEFGTSGCLFRGANGTIQFTMERRDDTWVVSTAFYSEP